ncbi:hypothetical protein BABA_24755 [Neobacillus bataviensis LMG 21833]|uniref:DUF4190 domain-containing protein n=1 Tax=Neobacillus bataviensis LMG 21833 TaxID=1117379 RepID=K6BXG8_9BACI|nr:hypothetical protein BABA_24755 [Neobacillus bataviensis LMG 21833]
MAEERDTRIQEALPIIGQDIPNSQAEFREEAASEIAAPIKTSYTLKKEEPVPEIGASVPIRSAQYREETAAEIAAPVPLVRRREHDEIRERSAGGTGMGTLALALSILSLFVLPILFGAAGIVLGFVARSKGATGLGAWAIGIGVISIVVGIFILPFF